MNQVRDTAGIIAPPPVIALGAILLGIGLDWLLPIRGLVLLPLEIRIGSGLLLAVCGGAFALAGMGAFRRGGTNIDPFKPSTTLVTSGIYARLRNPMYVGLGFLVTGIGIALASDWTLVMLAAAALLLHFGVVRREERYLEAKFGDAYRHYKETVPRYGWPG